MEPSLQAILLDANLLVLLAVGHYDKSLIGRKRLDNFSAADYVLLNRLMMPFQHNLTTPHVLAETSNLADHTVPRLWLREFREFLGSFLKEFDERWTPAAKLGESDEFKALGLADAGIVQLASERTLVLSVDAELCSVLWGRGINAENFNYLRER